MFSLAGNSRPKAWLVMAAACWGLGAVLSKAALGYMPPLTLLITQLISSLAVLWPSLGILQVLYPHGSAPTGRRQLLALGLLGVLNPGISYTLSLLGLSLTTASSSALFWAMEPLLIIGLAWLILRERAQPGFLLLTAAAVAGAMLVVAGEWNQAGLLLGNALILGGVACCALYTVLARRMREGISPLLTVTLQESLALGWACLIWPAEFSRTTWASLTHIPANAWVLAGLSGVIYYGLAFCLYLGGLQRVSAGEAGFFINPRQLRGSTWCRSSPWPVRTGYWPRSCRSCNGWAAPWCWRRLLA